MLCLYQYFGAGPSLSCSFCHYSLMGTLSLIRLLNRRERPNKPHRKAWDPSPHLLCRSTAGPIRNPSGSWESEKISKNQPGRGDHLLHQGINAIADILDHEIIETEETLQNQSPERAKHFKNTLMVRLGANDLLKKISLFPGAYKLVQGEHLTDK